MDITRIESIYPVWDEARDSAFFGIASRVFSAKFLYGAGVLLACNDLDANSAVAAPAPRRVETELTTADAGTAVPVPEKT